MGGGKKEPTERAKAIPPIDISLVRTRFWRAKSKLMLEMYGICLKDLRWKMVHEAWVGVI